MTIVLYWFFPVKRVLLPPFMIGLKTHTFSNGLRLVHQALPAGDCAAVAHLGLIIDTGSRDEMAKQNGMAHFIEHLIFKGTKKRKAFHVLSRMEDVGGELNAYTSKEETVIESAFLAAYYERAIELIADIIQHSTFPQKEMDKEVEVIIDEINSYKDSPSDQIFDDFDTLIFPKHALGRNILGSKARLKTFDREQVKAFFKQSYTADKMVLSSVGDVPFDKLCQWVERYLGSLPAAASTAKRKAPDKYVATTVKQKKRVHQAHCMIGNQAYGVKDDKRVPFVLLNNYLGGPGLNNRLNLSIRERYGFTYYLESNYTAYTDAGIFSIYMGTDEQYLDKSIKLVHKELAILRDKALGPLQLKKAKLQLMGQMAISEASNANKMINNGRSLLYFGKISHLSEVNEKIEAIVSSDIQQVAQEVFDPAQLSTLIFY